MPRDPGVWVWFRRLILGTFIEGLHEAGLQVDASTAVIAFDEESIFKFPAFNNHLHFLGEVSATVITPPDQAQLDAVRDGLQQAWPELVTELRRFPLPDRLAVQRNQVEVVLEGDRLTLRFDLDAD